MKPRHAHDFDLLPKPRPHRRPTALATAAGLVLAVWGFVRAEDGRRAAPAPPRIVYAPIPFGAPVPAPSIDPAMILAAPVAIDDAMIRPAPPGIDDAMVIDAGAGGRRVERSARLAPAR